MSLARLNQALAEEMKALEFEGRAKAPERVVVGYVPPQGEWGPRYRLAGSEKLFIRMNSNAYLSLAHDPRLLKAADEAARKLGVGPGAVRFIDGTSSYHEALEKHIAAFVGKPAAKIFNSAYTANLGQALTLASLGTYWIGDELNHNSIIRAMRIAGVPRENRAIYQHNNVDQLVASLEKVPRETERVVVIFDGVFSMRGDFTPLAEVNLALEPYRERFPKGLVTVMDDSHGIGAYGPNGRGTEDHCQSSCDVLIGTFGKAFSVNGGFVASSPEVIEAIRQKADTYIYTNPLGVGDCAAALEAVAIADSEEGQVRLRQLQERTRRFREGVAGLGWETIPGPHPIVPLLVRDTVRAKRLVQHFFDNGVLVVGLTYPVVPRGEETIRFQLNACHTEADVAYVLDVLSRFAG